jgi:hypothetical protein
MNLKLTGYYWFRTIFYLLDIFICHTFLTMKFGAKITIYFLQIMDMITLETNHTKFWAVKIQISFIALTILVRRIWIWILVIMFLMYCILLLRKFKHFDIFPSFFYFCVINEIRKWRLIWFVLWCLFVVFLSSQYSLYEFFLIQFIRMG